MSSVLVVDDDPGVLDVVAFTRFCSRHDCRLRTLLLHRNRFANSGHNSLNIRQGGILVNRIVPNHDIAFANENWGTNHAIPKIGLRR